MGNGITSTQKAQIIALRESNLPIRKIASETRLSPNTVNKYVQKDKRNELSVDDGFSKKVTLLKKKYLDKLFLKEHQLVSSLTSDKISKANLLQIATSFGIVFDKRRLASNQSTANISVISNLDKNLNNMIGG